jgi:predicted RNA binding protein YcfA (HicA-like mRNA interferase family)
MSGVETNTRKLIGRLERIGWVRIGGGSYDKFKHHACPGVIILVPHHRTLSMGRRAIHRQVDGWERSNTRPGHQ